MFKISKKTMPLTIVAMVVSVLEFISFYFLSCVSFESSENVPLVLVFIALSFVAEAILLVFDKWHIVSFLSFALAVISLFAMIGGRVSYLAFFFSGDITGIGLSIYLLTGLAFAVAAVALDVVLVLKKRD